ncbi:LamG-like jellyroll fold domain-containing protein [Bacteroidota bacterium]
MKKYIFFLFLIINTIYISGQDLTDSLLLLYPFSGNANDISGNEFHATLINATLTTDKSGTPNSAYSFNGSSQYIDYPQHTKLKPNLPFTVSAWFYTYSLSSPASIFDSDLKLGYYSGGSIGYNANYHTINLTIGDGGLIDPSNRRSKRSTSTLSANTWYHIVGIYRGTSNMDIYINGINDGGIYTGSGGNLAYSLNSGSIGRAPNNQSYTNGKIDDIGFWSRELTVAEIQQLYNRVPFITVHPVSDTLYQTDTILFTTLAYGDSLLYQWQKNSVNISGANGNTLLIQNIQYSDAGDYRCIVSNSKGSDTSDIATLTLIILAPPSITSQPSQEYACLGDTAFFHVSVSGSFLSYQWYNSNTPLSGATNSILTITPVTYADTAGNYFCIVTNGVGSDTSNMVKLSIVPPPIVSLGPLYGVCVDHAPFLLTGGSPYGGTYSGNYIAYNIFTPANAGAGQHVITYTFIDTNSCSGTAYQTLSVYPLPQVSFNNTINICANSSPFVLTGGTPANGIYTGTGVSNNVFNPITAGPGNHVITYYYTDGNQCSNSATNIVYVRNLPNVNFNPLPNVCSNTNPFILIGGTPAGGQYSGTGVTSNVFYPGLAGPGNHTITYTFTDAYSCTDTALQNITVYQATNVTLNPFSSLCINTPPLTLSGGNPPGGTYSGTFVNNGIFYPANAGTGTHVITYTYINANSCVSSATQNISVYTVPLVAFNPLSPVCESDQPFALSGGIPGGGIYSGNGVYNNIFFPDSAGAGTHTITYTYFDTTSCSNSTTQPLTVYASPSTSLSPFNAVCSNLSPFALSGGLPLGGTYSGLGVNNGIFFPSLAQPGTHNITYTYTDPLGCVGFSLQPITVYDLPTAYAGLDQTICEGNCVFLHATGGMYYAWNSGASTDTTTVCPLANTIYYITVTNVYGCSDKDSVIITVHPKPIIDLGNDTVICNNHNIILNPGSGYSSYHWSNGSILSALVVDYSMGPGSYSVTVTDIYGCTASDTIEIEFDPCAGIKENDLHTNLQIFPNPGSTELTILITDIDNSTFQIAIYNSLGELITNKNWNNYLPDNCFTDKIDISNYPKGVYYLKITSANNFFIRKFIKN